MNKRLGLLLISSTFLFFLIFTLYSSLRTSPHSSDDNEIKHSIGSSAFKLFNKKKNAFATIICDPSMLEPTMVSIYSLNAAYAKKPSSKTDIIVLLPESEKFNAEDIQRLEKLGTHVIKTSFPQSLIQSQNSYDTIINLWALFNYGKVVYFAPDVIFDNNVDQLFNYPVRSFVESTYTSPLFVLEPNANVFESLVREFIKKNSTNVSLPELLEEYYLDPKLRIPQNSLNKNIRFFTGPMKPWNFQSYSDIDWKKHYDPVSLYQWRRINSDVRHLFNPYSEWDNQERQRVVCDSYLKSASNISDFPVQDKFSVMISTYNPERIEHLSLLIRHLLKSPKIHTVFITWHNPALTVPETLYDQIRKEDFGRIKVLSQTYDSLNNRFNPVDDLQTDSVYIMDDDIFVDLSDLEFTFSAWKARKDSIVGHFPRKHSYNSETKDATYKMGRNAPYTIILTKSMFIRSEYLFAYTCLLEPKLHEQVDSQLNCEDLGFAMLASGISGTAPTYVRTHKPMEDFGLKKGISTNKAHMPARAKCISEFITNYWNRKDPLIESYDSVAPFVRPQIRTGDWNRVEQLISAPSL